jgi:hypothetical protein
MPRPFLMVLASVFAFSLAASARAQASSVAVPAWIAEGSCGERPKFEASLDGKPVPVIDKLGPSSDQVILVVMDLTSGLSRIEPAKQALIAQLSKLHSNIWVALLDAQNGLHVLADPGAKPRVAIAAIRTISNVGEPGMLETVTSALALADGIAGKSRVRVSVLYITDGSIYSYREDYTDPVINQSDPHDLSRRFPEVLIEDKIADLMDAIRSIEAPLFVVQLHYRSDRLNEAYQNGLDVLARATGGDSYTCQSVAGIPDAIARMFARISDTWLLTLRVPAKSHSDIEIHLAVPCRKANPSILWRRYFHLKEG